MKKVRIARPTPALVISLIALFVALGGTGYAALSITGKNVKNSSLTGSDIKNSSLTGSDVKTSGLTGSDVKSNSLTGSDISESALGKVPSAAAADSAASAATAGNVGGVSLVKINYTAPVNTAISTQIFNAGGLTLNATCNGGGVVVRAIGAPGQLRSYGIKVSAPPAPVNFVNNGNWPGTEINLMADDSLAVTSELSYHSNAGTNVIIHSSAGKPTGTCGQFFGTAEVG